MNLEQLQALLANLEEDLKKASATIENSVAQQTRILGSIDAVRYIIAESTPAEPTEISSSET